MLFAAWNGWALWLFGRHETGLLPGQQTHAMIEEGPYRREEADVQRVAGERFLHERFGAPYDDYRRRVRRWL